jgi:AcrR family transcriptional regulator
MTAKAEDRRMQRTRALLLSALLDLIVEQRYEDITVQDIVDRANVGRSTFYAHFLDKHELLLTGVDGLQRLLAPPRAAQDSSGAPRACMLGFSLPLFQHIQSNLRFCQALLGSHAGVIVEPRIQHILADLVRAELAACIPADTVPRVPLDIIVLYIVNAFLGLLRWWITQPTPCAAEEIDRQFRVLTIPAITTALAAPALAD